jgi:hypothetical protein
MRTECGNIVPPGGEPLRAVAADRYLVDNGKFVRRQRVTLSATRLWVELLRESKADSGLVEAALWALHPPVVVIAFPVGAKVRQLPSTLATFVACLILTWRQLTGHSRTRQLSYVRT